MKDGFIKAAALTPQIRVADPAYNAEQVIQAAVEADLEGVRLMVFPASLPGRLYGGRSPQSGDASLCGAKRVEARRGRNFLRRCICSSAFRFGQTA